MFYAVAGQVGATAAQRARVVHAVKTRIEQHASAHWDAAIPPT